MSRQVWLRADDVVVPSPRATLSLRILARLPKKTFATESASRHQHAMLSPATITSSEAGSSIRCLAGPERSLPELGLRTRAQFSISCRNRIVCHTDAVAAIILVQLFWLSHGSSAYPGRRDALACDQRCRVFAPSLYRRIHSDSIVSMMLRTGRPQQTEGSR